MTQRLLKPILSLVVLTTLAACSTGFRSNVTSFHIEVPPAGARVQMTPINENKKDSLEFKAYGDMIQATMGRAGFARADSGSPDYIVGYDVIINDGREKIRSFGGVGFNRGFWGPGWGYGGFWGPAWGGGAGFGAGNITSRTVYRAELAVEIRKPDGTMVFEGRAEADTRKRSLPELVPMLAEALFREFPGENGKTRRVSITMD